MSNDESDSFATAGPLQLQRFLHRKWAQVRTKPVSDLTTSIGFIIVVIFKDSMKNMVCFVPYTKKFSHKNMADYLLIMYFIFTVSSS